MIERETTARRRSSVGGPTFRYVLMAATLMAVAYGALYFPYRPGSLPVRGLSLYLRLIARMSGVGVRLFDGGATVSDDLVQGRFALRIVLDCAALDAHALYAAAVLAFPVAWSRRLAGVLAGTVVVALVNITRIVALYVVGMRWPSAFHVWHEEVLQFAIILFTFLAFGIWIMWARRATAR